MGIIALALSHKLDDFFGEAVDILSGLLEAMKGGLDPEEIEAKLSGVIGDVGIKARKFGLADADSIFEKIRETQAELNTVDPSTIDIGDDLRAGIEKKVQAWKEKTAADRKQPQSADDLQNKMNSTLGAATLDWQADQVRNHMTMKVQNAIAGDMNAGALAKDAFARLSAAKQQTQDLAQHSPHTKGASL